MAAGSLIGCLQAVCVEIGKIRKIDVSIGDRPRCEANLGNSIVVGTVPVYHGRYEITPAGEAQRISTEGTRLEHDIIVAPIPQNYGLITWNGSFIRVS